MYRTFIIRLAFILACCITLPAHAADEAKAPPKAMPAPTETGVQPFGAALFNGNFLKTREDGLNPNYVVAPGDQVNVRTWGAVNINDIYTVDSQGNIFLPDIGPLHLEGVNKQGGGWAVLDYGDVIVHLFTAEMRKHYDLEELWDQANVVVKVI